MNGENAFADLIPGKSQNSFSDLMPGGNQNSFADLIPSELAVSHRPYTTPGVDLSLHPEFGLLKRRKERFEKKVAEREEDIASGTSLRQGKPKAITETIAEHTIPYYGVLSGQQKLLSPETMMEAPVMIGIGALIGAIARPILGKFGKWFRMLTNKERGLVVQSVEETLAKSNAVKEAIRTEYGRKGFSPRDQQHFP